MDKLPFEIEEMLNRIENAIKPFPKAAMFELAERGFDTVFQQLVACIISIRTTDEVSLPVALELLTRAPTPSEILELGQVSLDQIIHSSTFHEAKARQILAIAKTAVERYNGILPGEYDVLTSFNGVGPKCANLAAGIASGSAGISVDIHVHRVTNRWGLVKAAMPERTMEQLQDLVPRHRWLDVNRLLVPFGKHICTGRLPKCSTCPVLQFCRQVGVERHR